MMIITIVCLSWLEETRVINGETLNAADPQAYACKTKGGTEAVGQHMIACAKQASNLRNMPHRAEGCPRSLAPCRQANMGIQKGPKAQPMGGLLTTACASKRAVMRSQSTH